MTIARQAGSSRKKRSLRHRMIVSLTGLAVIPLLAALASLFFMVRSDIEGIRGSQLAHEARQLTDQLRGEFQLVQQAAAGLAASPEVVSYLAGSGPFPEQLISPVRKSVPGVLRIDLVPGGGSVQPGNGSTFVSTTGKDLAYRMAVAGSSGKPVGTLAIYFVPEGVRWAVEQSGKENTGEAVLFTAKGERLAGGEATPLPPPEELESGWTTFRSGDVTYLAGVTAVAHPGGTAPRGWFLAVVQPVSQVFGHLYLVSRQIALFTIIFVILVATMAWWMADQYMRPILEITRGAEIISRINLDHRIKVDAGDEIKELAIEFNLMAENLGKAYNELEGRVRDATMTLQEERNRLATVLRTMVDGVIVANEAAETILMNPRARIILGRGYSSGIGAPLSRIFPGERLGFHLNRLRRGWEPGREVVEEVIFPLRDGKLLKGSLSVIPGPGGERAGFLLVFRDLNALSGEDKRFEDTLLEMPLLLRGPVATSHALIETLQRHQQMSAEKQRAFLAALAEEMDRLSVRLTAIEEAASSARTSRWPAIPSDPRELLEEAVSSAAGISIEINSDQPLPAVLVEPFSWVASLRCALHWLEQRGAGQIRIGANLKVEEGAVVTTFRVSGPFAGDPNELETLELVSAGEEPIPLGEAVRRNHGELWTRSSGESMEVRLALLQATAAAESSRAVGLIEGEPEFYNFDLFLPRPVLERADLLQAELADLDYVVVDTETTGLQLSHGDRVVSISAIRIQRGRMQNSDIFNTLVNPGRPIPPESTEIHGIDDRMVADAPAMSDVYPQFVEYLGNSILVAHNAAFDKQCLDMAAAEAGLPPIDNPVLDTIFLSYALHKEIEGHSLEAIAERMGIIIEGRHSSLGDARAAAQIFLGLMTLLPGRGVRTLAEAKSFCDQHLLLRWQTSRF